MALAGPSGKICVINTESGAVEKYLGLSPDGTPFDFDIAEMPDFAPTRYTQLIQEAGREGYDVIIIDSLSHAWAGSGGALELKDRKGGNSFTAWKDITPMHNAMIEAILRSPAHVIATMRTKVGYVIEEEVDPKTGAKKSVPKKIGMEPVQRQGMEYEFDVVADMDNETHTLKVTKSRCPTVDGAVVVKPGVEFIEPVKKWLEEGTEVDPSFYATKPGDLRANQEAEAERAAEQQREQAAAQAAAQRRAELQAMAGQPAAAAATTAAPAEPPPFDGGVQARASTEQLTELVQIGALIGRTPQMIAEECRQKLGCRPDELPLETFNRLLAAFKQIEQQARAAKNQSAA